MGLTRRGARTAPSPDALSGLVQAAAAIRVPGEPAELRRRACAIGARLVGATGAVLYLEGPGLLVAAARWGIHRDPERGELGVQGLVERTLRTGHLHVAPDRTVLVPVDGPVHTVGVLSLAGLRDLAAPDADALLVYGHLVGETFQRHGSGLEPCGRDPVTGVGDHGRADAALASLRPGDGVVLCEVDGIGRLRRADPARADLVQGQLGLHVRNTVRPGDAAARSGADSILVVLRHLQAPLDVFLHELVDRWRALDPRAAISAGAALHVQGAPADTLDAVRRLLSEAQAAGGDRAYLAVVDRAEVRS